MAFQLHLSWQLFTETYGIFLLFIGTAILLDAVSCALVLGAVLRKTRAFSLHKAVLLMLMSLVLNADLARLLELALHTGLFSLRSGITHVLVALFLWLLVLSFLKEKK